MEPKSSLPAFLEELEAFGRVSGFPVNLGKPLILNLNPKSQVQRPAGGRLSGILVAESVPYLGLEMAATILQTVNINYDRLVQQIKKDLCNWGKHHLLLLGRIAAVKMTLLPKALYLFQTLLASPPEGAITSLQQDINHFIWAGARPRMSRDLSYRRPEHGDLGITNLLDYYQAAQLRYLVEWNKPESEKRWLFQDRALTGIPLWKVPFLKKA